MGGVDRLRREGGSSGAAEYDECRPLFANRHEIAAHPRLYLARSCPVAQSYRIKLCPFKALVEVLADRGRFRQGKVIVYERRDPPGDRRCGVSAFLLSVGENLEGFDVEGQALLDKTDVRNQGIRTGKIGIDVEKHVDLSNIILRCNGYRKSRISTFKVGGSIRGGKSMCCWHASAMMIWRYWDVSDTKPLNIINAE